jgi:hypothetical protein
LISAGKLLKRKERLRFSVQNLLSFFFAPPVERAAVAPITTVLTEARSWSRKLLPTSQNKFCWRKPLLISIGKIEGWRIRIMFSYTSAISKKWLAIVFHGLKLGNIRNPFGHFFGHSSATLSAISYVTDRTAHRDLEKLVEREGLIVYTGFLWGPFGPVLRGWARNASKESSKSSQSWPNFIPSNSF